jgi:DNA-binding beta-propeller fold protein YncE
MRARAFALVAGLAAGLAMTSQAAARTNLTIGMLDGGEVIAIAQQDLHRVDIMRLDADGATLLRRLGTHGSGPGQLDLPEGAVVVAGGNVWVSDTANDRLQEFDRDGRVIRSVGDLGGRAGRLRRPGALAAAPGGHLLVPDLGNNRIVELDGDGSLVRAWGRRGGGPGKLLQPHALALSPDGSRVYVIDTFRRQVQMFTTAGRYLGRTPSPGPPPGLFISPTAIATAPDGSVLVTDEMRMLVTRLRPDLRVLDVWGQGHGTVPGTFYNPQGIAVDRAGRVWVIDYNNHRGQVYSLDGRYLFAFAAGRIGMNPPAGRRPAESRWWLALVAVLAIGGGAWLFVTLTGGPLRRASDERGEMR